MDPIVNEMQEQMEKSVRSLNDNFGKLRSAQANPSILNGIKADYYGDKIAITDICSITKPEPRQLVVKPYSHEDLKAVATAITAANIGIRACGIPPLWSNAQELIYQRSKSLE